MGLNAKDATGLNGAAGDPDGDGLSNAQEQSTGTDPNAADTPAGSQLKLVVHSRVR